MDKDTLILILVLIVSFAVILQLFFYVFIMRERRNIADREKETGVHLNYQREKLEERLYNIESQIAMDGDRFADTNHLLLKEKFDDSYNDGMVPNPRFFTSLGIDITGIEVERDKIGCIMPFHKTYTKRYDTIKRACEKGGYKCHRSDENFNPNNILRMTLELILSSRFIIALLDGRNPNVYYEMGICHSLGKKVIMIANASNMENIPYDIVSNNRVIFYNNPTDLEHKLINYLKELPHANK